MTDTTQTTLDRRCAAAHPETIDIGTDTLVRDDVMARKYGVTRRTLGRRDPDGAPYILVGNIKYRPEAAFTDYVKSLIQVRRQRHPSRKAVRR